MARRDHDFWGSYLVARLDDASTKLRIFVDHGRYVVDISQVPELEGTARRLTLDYASRDELLACLDHLLAAAGNPSLMTSELRVTLADHAARATPRRPFLTRRNPRTSRPTDPETSR